MLPSISSFNIAFNWKILNTCAILCCICIAIWLVVKHGLIDVTPIYEKVRHPKMQKMCVVPITGTLYALKF